MKLYRTSSGVFVEENEKYFPVAEADWDDLISSSDLYARVRAAIGKAAASSFDPASVLAPVVSQEVWAAGVTYYRSRTAGTFFQSDGSARGGTGGSGAHSIRCEVVGARAGADSADESSRRNCG